MNWIDYTIIATISLSTLLGLIRGLIQEAFALISWIASLWISLHYWPTGANWLAYWLPQAEKIRAVLAFILIFVVVLIVGKALGHIISSLIDKSFLRGINRIGGMAFGGVRGVLLVLILIWITDFFGMSSWPEWQKSRLLPYLKRWSEALSEPYKHHVFYAKLTKI
ncbi:MAG: CvpA family protein [Methylohalobius sp.]|nr:CvpA family protein [Methylohalobius sp.]